MDRRFCHNTIKVEGGINEPTTVTCKLPLKHRGKHKDCYDSEEYGEVTITWDRKSKDGT
jgi:hypothetical protein